MLVEDFGAGCGGGAFGASSLAIVAMVSCTAISGVSDLAVCSAAECANGAEADASAASDASGNASGVDASSSALFTIGGAVSVLAGKGLTLKNATVDQIPINTNGPYTFPTKMRGGESYSVTVGSQPSDPTHVG